MCLSSKQHTRKLWNNSYDIPDDLGLPSPQVQITVPPGERTVLLSSSLPSHSQVPLLLSNSGHFKDSIDSTNQCDHRSTQRQSAKHHSARVLQKGNFECPKQDKNFFALLKRTALLVRLLQRVLAPGLLSFKAQESSSLNHRYILLQGKSYQQEV